MKIGDKLKNLRLTMGLTQAELAVRCDLSKNFISLLETDQTSPSLSTLEDVLHCLGTDFKTFFSDEEAEETVVYTKEEVCVKDMSEESGYKIQWLVSDAQKYTMEPVMLTLNEGAQTDLEEAHNGEEYGYVLAGNIALVIGNKPHKVHKGESFYFTPNKPHYIKNNGKITAKVLWVATPPTF